MPRRSARPTGRFQGCRCGSLLVKLIDQQNRGVSAEEIDEYLDGLEEPKRATLARLRQTILDIIPEAEQGISYGVPAFNVRGKTVAGFAAFKNHLSYLPHSGAVFPQLSDELRGYSISSGATPLQYRRATSGAAGRETHRGAAGASLSRLRDCTRPGLPVRRRAACQIKISHRSQTADRLFREQSYQARTRDDAMQRAYLGAYQA